MNQTSSSQSEVRHFSATMQSLRASGVLYGQLVTTTASGQVRLMASGPESTLNEEERTPKTEWFDYSEWPGPYDSTGVVTVWNPDIKRWVERESQDSYPCIVSNSNWKNFKEYKGKPTKVNFLKPGAVLIDIDGQPLGVVESVEIEEMFLTGEFRHHYKLIVATVLTSHITSGSITSSSFGTISNPSANPNHARVEITSSGVFHYDKDGKLVGGF